MSDVPGPPPGGPDGPDRWDAWRSWSAGSSDPEESPGAWDAWKAWQWTPRARPPMGTQIGCSGCGGSSLVAIIAVVVVFLLLSSFLGSLGGGGDLPADDLVAAIDALPVTGPRDERPPDTAAGETATFAAPTAGPSAVADQIQAVRAPSRRDTSESSTFMLYEEATVVVQRLGDGSEVVVFDDNRAATRRFPTILLLPGWSGTLTDFDTRARSRGGIGGFRGGGGGVGK